MPVDFDLEVDYAEDAPTAGETQKLKPDFAEVVEAESTLEQVFAASLLARPDLLQAVSPDPRTISDPTVRAMVSIVQSQGEAYTAPGPMWAALDALPYSVNSLVAEAILSTVPGPQEVDLGRLLKLKTDVELAAVDRTAQAKIDRAVQRFGKAPREMLYAEIREALELAERAKHVERDHTTKGIRERLRTAPPKVRWRIGSRDLDEAFMGVDREGKAGCGLLGAGEIVVLAAPYGVGKSRMAYNWANQLLMQGASVAFVQLEDEETSVSAKMMGVHADVEHWKVLQFARGEAGFIGEDSAKLTSALDWFDSLGDRLRIYDGEARANIFNIDEALGLLELDARMYKTDAVIIDYIQSFAGSDYEAHARNAQMLRAFAGRHRVNVIEISQMSNDTIRWGSAAGQVAAKGGGDYGAAAHVGIELGWEEAVGQAELSLNLKKARDARRQIVYAQMNEDTGRVKSYSGTPLLLSLPEKKADKKGGRR